MLQLFIHTYITKLKSIGYLVLIESFSKTLLNCIPWVILKEKQGTAIIFLVFTLTHRIIYGNFLIFLIKDFSFSLNNFEIITTTNIVKVSHLGMDSHIYIENQFKWRISNWNQKQVMNFIFCRQLLHPP